MILALTNMKVGERGEPIRVNAEAIAMYGRNTSQAGSVIHMTSGAMAIVLETVEEIDVALLRGRIGTYKVSSHNDPATVARNYERG